MSFLEQLSVLIAAPAICAAALVIGLTLTSVLEALGILDKEN
jgi:hypothetical protein